MRRAERGLTLLEVLAAVAVLGLLYTVLASAAVQGLRSEGESRRRLEASLLMDEQLVQIRIRLDVIFILHFFHLGSFFLVAHGDQVRLGRLLHRVAMKPADETHPDDGRARLAVTHPGLAAQFAESVDGRGKTLQP